MQNNFVTSLLGDYDAEERERLRQERKAKVEARLKAKAEERLIAGETTAETPNPKILHTDSKSTDSLGRKLSAKTAVFGEGEWADRLNLEDAWQNKVKKDTGIIGSDKKSGVPDNTGKVIFGDRQSTYDEYDKLWMEWFEQNPDVYAEAKAKRLEGYEFLDRYGKAGDARQDETIMRLIDSGWEPETTPEIKTVGWIDELADNEIFVFGSNQEGIHGKGAALDAKNKFGAVQGVGEGLTGQTYALPTKSTPYKSLTIDEVSKNLDTFLEVAKNNPDKTFKMSAIGTNLAGFEAQEIANLLFSKDIPSNVHVPESLFKLKGGTPEVKGNQVTNEDLQKAIDNLFDKVDGTPEKALVDHATFGGGLVEELENMGYKSEVVESSINKWFDINADSEFLKYEFNWNDIPDANLPETTPEVKPIATVYNTIENPRGLNHYVNRTLYNYANSDITFDFTATGGPSGGGNSAGKGTPDYMTKWNNVAVDNAGKLTASNINEIAQKLADALTSGQTVNIAGHGNYSSIRGGFPKAVWQSQVDGTMQTIFDKAIELAGDKPITGKVISGGQSGFDEAGIRTARNLGIPTEVNVTDYTWRDAGGEHVKDEQGFKDRVDADSYDSETYRKPGGDSLGAAIATDPVFTENPELDPAFISQTANENELPRNALKVMLFKHGIKLLPALNIFRTLGIVDEAIELVADKVLKNVPGFKNTSIGKSIANKGIGLMWVKAELANLFAHHQVAAGTSTAILDAQMGNLIWANLTDTEIEDLPEDTQELLAQDIGEVYREVFAPGETSAFEQIDLYTLDKTGKRQMDWAIHAGKYGYNWIRNLFMDKAEPERFKTSYGWLDYGR